MNTKPWAQNFGLKPEQLTAWKNQIGPHEDLLRWCLLEGHIPEVDYLRWAAQAYELPIVKQNYFAVGADPVFWLAVRDRFKWSPSLLPLAEWQGVLLIGCLEPPVNLPYHEPHRFVLASARDLDRLWKNLNTNAQPASQAKPASVGVAQPVAPAVAPPPPPIAVRPPVPPTPVAQTPPPMPKPVAPAQAQSAPTPQPTLNIADLNVPDGIVLNKVASAALKKSEPAATKPSELEVPSGVKLDASKVQPLSGRPDGLGQVNAAPLTPHPDGFTNTAPATPAIKIEKPQITPPPVPVAQAASVVTPVHQAVVPPPPAPVAPPLPTQETQIGPAPVAPVTPMQPSQAVAQAVPAPTPAPKATPSTSKSRFIEYAEMTQPQMTPVTVSVSVKVVPLNTATSFEDLATITLAHVMRVFEHGVLFLFNEGKMRPWKWTELLLSTKGNIAEPIDFGPPSIFRIVLRTNQPYHGYVMPSPVNNKFFNDFYRGALPKHATLVPIAIDGQLAGMIMGLSDLTIDYKKSLAHLESLSKDVAVELGRLGHQASGNSTAA